MRFISSHPHTLTHPPTHTLTHTHTQMSEGVEDLSAYPKAKDPMAASFAATTAAAVLKAPIVSISQSLAQAPPPPPPTHTNSRVVPPSAVVTTNNNVVAPPPPLPMPVKTTPTATSSSKYSQLLAVIEDMGRDIRPTYAGSKSSVERIKRHIVHARILVRECLMECERAARS